MGTGADTTGTLGSAKVADAHRLPRAVYALARRHDRASLVFLDGGVIAGAWFVAYFAGLEAKIPSGAFTTIAVFVGLALVTQLVVNRIAGLYSPVWRYASVNEAVRVIGAVGAGTAVSAIELVGVGYVTDTATPFLTAPPVAALIMLLGCGGIRFQARLFALERRRVRTDGAIRTLIVGAGHVGAALALELNRDEGHLEVVGFIDDDARLRGRLVRGLCVLGATEEIERVCREHRIERVVIAVPQAGPERRREIVELALKTDAQVKVLPEASDLVAGPLLRSLRDLDLTDLLGRAHAPVDTSEIAGYLGGATVLVTGAGGSIGCEIARQVAGYAPAKLLLLDRDESLLYETLAAEELRDAELVLVDIRDRAQLRAILARHRPDVVFHAAAYKHVPILERHPVEAVHTNLLGSWWLATTAAQYGCRRFVYISTDKAAEPCSMMGASKRAAELVVFAVGKKHRLPCTAVRFGNVLGSRGSVVPTFLRQILEGGPITLTDPEMTRYFMTIPEAVSLVLQAGAMADGGKTFLLDMGEPVAIEDMARQMIRLTGLRPDDDIEIEVVGSRPGERLHEPKHDVSEVIEPTAHPSISSIYSPTIPSLDDVDAHLESLDRSCAAADGATVTHLLEQFLRDNGVASHLPVVHPDEITVDLVAAEAAERDGGIAAPPALPADTRRFDPEVPSTTSPGAKRGAIFVLPNRATGQQGPVAAWVSTAGWASAARRVLGEAWIATSSGLVDPEEARRRASHPGLSAPAAPTVRRRVPTVAKTAIKDARQWLRARQFRLDVNGSWRDRDLVFVWQRHDMFHTAGIDLARALGIPSVLFVPAPLVWEARQWGVRRPGWSSWLERVAEAPALRGADLVACGSELVAEQVQRCGTRPERILVTPTGVDLELFASHSDDAGPLRARLGLTDRFVVGWVGSFRHFHALGQAVHAVAEVDDAALLLVGDGPERARIERMAEDRGVTVVATGTRPYADLPAYLAAMDVALVLARSGDAFHYSPLKVAEYLAAGVPVVAPHVAQFTDRLIDGHDALLVPPGDIGALAAVLRKLHDDPGLRTRLGVAARASAEAHWSWDHQVERLVAALGVSRAAVPSSAVVPVP
ncbi:MAG: polysaccharide biosynthesis protein [Acidimicrobiia bacterium]